MANDRNSGKRSKGFEANTGNPVKKVDVTSGCRYYRVDLRHTSIGKAVRKNFTSAQKACAFASKTMAKAITGVAKPQPQQRTVDTQREAMEILNPFNVSVSEAAAFYAKYHGSVERGNSVAVLVKEYIAGKQEEVDRGEMKPASLVDTKHFLKRFAAEFGPKAVDLVSPGELDCFLDEVNGSANRRSHRLYLSAFFNWTVSRGKLETNPVRKTRRIAKREKAPSIHTPGEVEQLMNEAEPKLVPYLALSFFSGARSTELLNIRWKNVDFEAEEISIPAKHSITDDKRVIKMNANLVRFLVPFRGTANALVVPHNQRSLQRWMKKLFTALEIEPIYQGARHTFSTYHLAVNPVAETMHEVGCTSNATLFRYCRKPTSELSRMAEAYFAIAPKEQGEIIPLEQEAA